MVWFQVCGRPVGEENPKSGSTQALLLVLVDSIVFFLLAVVQRQSLSPPSCMLIEKILFAMILVAAGLLLYLQSAHLTPVHSQSTPLLDDNEDNSPPHTGSFSLNSDIRKDLVQTNIKDSGEETCTFPSDTPDSCQLPLDMSLLAPGTTVHCVGPSVDSLVPWSMLICGPATDCMSGVVTHGRALIAIHGGPGQSSAVLQGLASLSAEIPLILYDQRNSGRSFILPTPSSTNIELTMKNYVNELSTVLDQFAVTSAHLLGHSFGASIAIDFAHAHPEHVASLTLLSPVIDGGWWREDADFHRKYVKNQIQDEVPSVGDQASSQELMTRWVLGASIQMSDVEPLLCRPSGEVYQTVWGESEDNPNGQVHDYHREEWLKETARRGIGNNQENRIPILLGCGLLDEATPSRMLSVMKTLNDVVNQEEKTFGFVGATSSSPSSSSAVPLVILPHSAHLVANSDWKYYVAAVGSFIRGEKVHPIGLTSKHEKRTVALSGDDSSDIIKKRNEKSILSTTSVETTIKSMQSTLRALESDPTVARRSYPYLGRLLVLNQAPPSGLQQLSPKDMSDLLRSLVDPNANIDWDVVQAVVDVWYVATILDSTKLHDPTLRPPKGVFDALCTRLKSYRVSNSPIDRIMYYVVGFGLHRLNVDGAPTFSPYNWKDIAKSGDMDMKRQYPAVYIYLLTHVYIYNTDFGTLPMEHVSVNVREEVEAAVQEMIEMMPLGMEERGFGRIFHGMMDPSKKTTEGLVVVDADTQYDCVCEMFFTAARVYGREHPVVNALAVLVYEFLSLRISNEREDMKNRGHLLAVCVGSWAVWEESPSYI